MYDLVIIGGSIAGTAAAVYSARRKLNFVMISDDFGGEVARSGEVWNYPGFPQTNGIELSQQLREQLTFNEVEPKLGVRVTAIAKQPEGHFLITATKGGETVTYEAMAVIMATGVHPRHLGVPGEDGAYGKGVTYCTTCDGPLFRNKKTITIGGGNTALESALMMSEIAEHVTLVNLNDTFRGEQILIDKVEAAENIEVIYTAETTEIIVDNVVKGIKYIQKSTGEEHTIEAQGVMVHIGVIPNTDFVGEEVEKNPFKEVKVDKKCATNIEGLFAAGDMTDVPYKQIAIAGGQGVVAALSAIEYINQHQ